MQAKLRISAVLAAILLSATVVYARGGGGGHGGGGHGGGGHGGGGGGHSFSHGGSSHTGSGGNHSNAANHSNAGNHAGNHAGNRAGNHAGNHLNNFSGNHNFNGNHGNFVHNNFARGNHWNHNNWNRNGWNHWGPGWWGGLGLFGLGYGLGAWGTGWGGYYNSGGYPVYANATYADTSALDSTVTTADGSASDPNATPPADNANAGNANAGDGNTASAESEKYISAGESDFKAGRYQEAARNFQHALVGQQPNGGLLLVLSQALFAAGDYNKAAGATQAAMQLLPEEQWGQVIKNYQQLYGNAQDYNNELKALENARNAKPDSPAIRFLLGFHFGYLGYPQQAVRELDKSLALAPKDPGALRIREIFAANWPQAPALPQAAEQALKEFKSGNKGQVKTSAPAGNNGQK